MAWQKLDDELTGATGEEPLSAFLARGLTRNANGYADGLSRTATFAFDNSDVLLTWASYDQPTGFVFTVDVGNNARQVFFDIVAATETATAGGTLVVRHLDSSTQRFTTYAADSSVKLTSVQFDFTEPMSGPQGFFIGWQSDVGDDLGYVRLRGGTENQVYIDQGTGPTHWSFPVAAGNGVELHALLKIDPQIATTSGVMPSGDGRLDYQICYFRHLPGNNPDGTFVIWPELDQTPAVLPNRYDANLQVQGHVWELGALNLWSVAMRVTQVRDGALALPNAYDQATTLQGVASAASTFLTPAMPSLAVGNSTPGRFGRILRAGETLYFTFAVQNDERWGVQVNFRAYSINVTQPNFNTPDLTLDVLDNTGGSLGGTVVLSKVSIPRFTPQTAYGASQSTLVCANGVYTAADGWGMRDAMPVQEVMRPVSIAMRWEPQPLNPVQVGGANVYTGAITSTSDLYIFGFFARVF